MDNLGLDSSRWGLVNNIIVAIVALYGIAVQDYRVGDASVFQKGMVEVLAPIQRGTLSMQESVSYTIDHYFMIVNTSKENESLRKNLAGLENEVFSLKEVQKENERLKKLLDFGKEIPRKKVLAQVVSWDSSNEFKVLRINKGEVHGLRLLSPVITMTGLVGYVYRLTPNYADILTILDQNNRVDAIVSRTRTHGIVEGHSGFTCHLKYVSRTEKLEIGDTILTAGLGEIYPKGIKVGRITKIDKENFGITQKIEITPSVDFHKLEEVVILVEDATHAGNDFSVTKKVEL
ncbi:MAG: rod shape-determining protein MreC [Halobacteriovoraceae bacterium]|nr:rod shape-determining protein MreC [Halobacteriovoraceae bacterium]